MRYSLLLAMILVLCVAGSGLAQSHHVFTFFQETPRGPAISELSRMNDSLTAKLDQLDSLIISTGSELQRLVDSGSSMSRQTELSRVLDTLKSRRNGFSVTETKLRSVEASIISGMGPLSSEEIDRLEDLADSLHKKGLRMKIPSDGDSNLSPSAETTDKDPDLLSSIRPSVFAGGAYKIPSFGFLSIPLMIKAGVFLSSPPPQKTEDDYLRAMMMPGAANVITSINWTSKNKNRMLKGTYLSLALGLKFRPGLTDTTGNGADSAAIDTDREATLVSHTLGVGGAIQFGSKLLFYGQWVRAWHNLTSESEDHFEKVFNRSHTAIDYLLLGWQFSVGSLGGQQSYMYLEWRRLRHARDFDPERRFGDSRFVTFGFRNEIGL